MTMRDNTEIIRVLLCIILLLQGEGFLLRYGACRDPNSTFLKQLFIQPLKDLFSNFSFTTHL